MSADQEKLSRESTRMNTNPKRTGANSRLFASIRGPNIFISSYLPSISGEST
jgi:hypothetical protein